MSESLGQEAFRVLEDVLVAEIASENKSIRENIDGLKGCQKMLDEVEICIGDETHVYSILEGEIGPDEPVRRCGYKDAQAEGNRIGISKVQVEMNGSTFNLPTGTTDATNEKKDTSLGTTIKFDMDCFQDTSFTLKSFKFMASEVDPIQGLGIMMNNPSHAPVASINYTGKSYVLNGCEANNRLDLKLAEDGSMRFFFCLDRATFQGTLHKIGPRDMARDIEELAKKISEAVFYSQFSISMLRLIGNEVDEDEFIRENYLYDSPDLYFDLNTISIQFTPGVHRAYNLTRKLKLCESKSLDAKSMNSLQVTESDSLRGKVAVVQGNEHLFDAIRTNKHLRGEVQSLSYMKSLLQNAVVRYGDEIEIDINLKNGVRLSDFLLEQGVVERPSDTDEQQWRVSCEEHDIVLEMNWLDKFSITLGATRHLRGMPTIFDLPRVGEHGSVQFKVGNAIVAGYIDFSSLHSMDYTEEAQIQMIRDMMNDNFHEKLSKAAFSGVDPGFPEWYKMKVYAIVFPMESVQMFLDI
ncbi:predicted protein [Chaetoceros tenuissimus]|uniref:Uncharacterized protein n=1 Tax=Chaetoceros tenuissimus TaxID=426638 RepID=A0AAD3D100_9STRA|nr:predicted protein [Chaetoceros tenuissimus]